MKPPVGSGLLSRRRLLTIGGAAAVSAGALAVAGCGGAQPGGSTNGGPVSPSSLPASWDDVVAQAKSGGKVNLYIAVPGLEERIQDGFRKAFPGIAITITRLASGDLLSRIDHERQAKADGGDVVIHGDLGWFQKNAKQLLTLGPSVDQFWKDSDQVFEDGKYVTSDYLPTQLLINTEALQGAGASPVAKYDDILQDKFAKGLIGLAGPNISKGQAQYWYYLYKIHGLDWFKRLASLKPDIYDNSVTQLTQAMGSGAHAAGLFSYDTITKPLIKAGAPIKVLTEEPVIVVSHKIGVPAWGKRPAAGQVLANWMLSRDGQIAMYGAGGVASPMPPSALGTDIPDTMIKLPADPKSLYVTDGVLTGDQTSFLSTVWKPTFNN